MLCMQNGDTELWLRWKALRIYQLQMGKYEVAQYSLGAGGLLQVSGAVQNSGEAQANRKFRIWVQENQAQSLAPAQTPSPLFF